MRIQVSDLHIVTEELTVQRIVAIAKQVLPLEERVPDVQGDAFDLTSWYDSWKRHHVIEAPEPTHVMVEAMDEFQAMLPWSQVKQALFLYAQEGQALKKGYPIRLYVPDGSSECLNVKGVVKIWFLHDVTLGEEATYGFKNTVSLKDLKIKK
ncbi:molybdopterin-dependent oxidoreductase [Paenibacillus sp. SYP-B3998]|uniref:Molybdopterin-dependent oxidoreductase n=1 Tax=Paenibacillus sp. SYP-B3998 TaxID=2678564 RepID=A0A6G4A1V2_9BACL|nr:molybdopterin-dependent oxidoreductase [Paenibacillus sp. SYP-B3998]